MFKIPLTFMTKKYNCHDYETMVFIEMVDYLMLSLLYIQP